ncbi:DUF4291 domain-containing protein [Clostridium gasigenes]|nr:DUF4291 domain-containing protein [Clostridium gasigenes]MBU3107979.1 DUF4291 domain-containing protein [Clostridium gasigenes]
MIKDYVNNWIVKIEDDEKSEKIYTYKTDGVEKAKNIFTLESFTIKLEN